jgi:hypothetical protein
MSDKVLLAGEGSGKSVVVTRQATIGAAIMLQAGNLCKNAQYYEAHGKLMTEKEHDRLFDEACVAFGVDLADPLKQYKVSLSEYLELFNSAMEFLLQKHADSLVPAVAARVRQMAKTYATGTWNDLPDRNKETG